MVGNLPYHFITLFSRADSLVPAVAFAADRTRSHSILVSSYVPHIEEVGQNGVRGNAGHFEFNRKRACTLLRPPGKLGSNSASTLGDLLTLLY